MLRVAECRKCGMKNHQKCPHKVKLRKLLKSANLGNEYVLKWNCPHWLDETPLARIDVSHKIAFKVKQWNSNLGKYQLSDQTFNGITVSFWGNGYLVAVTRIMAVDINVINKHYRRLDIDDLSIEYFISKHKLSKNDVVIFPVRLKYVVEDLGIADVNEFFAQNHGR